MGSNMKYELDKKTGMLSWTECCSRQHTTHELRFIPRTYADDHDPLDVLLLCSEPILPMTLVRSYPIGVMTMEVAVWATRRSLPFPTAIPPI
ncbi:MAG: inorganic diphosphatase [Ruminococcus sp.]